MTKRLGSMVLRAGAACAMVLTMASNAAAQECPAVGKGNLPLKYAGPATKPAITPCDLMTRLYKYSDDSMMGRLFGSPANLKSTEYIESEVRRLGLQPAGDSGGYFQDVGVPLNYRALDPASTLTAGGTVYHGGVDFAAMSGGRPIQLADAQVIYGGLSGDTLNLLAPDAVQGKVLILRPGPGLRFTSAAQVQASVGYQAYLKMINAAAATINVSPDRNMDANLRGSLNPARPVGAVPDRDTKLSFAVSSAMAAKLLGSPVETATKGATGVTLSSDIRFTIRKTSARNVVAILPGSDPKLKGQFVAIGAHNDHIGFSLLPQGESDSLKIWGNFAHPAGAEGGRDLTQNPIAEAEWATINKSIDSMRKIYPARQDSISNGADDDGSGTVSVLEIAEAFAKGSLKPKRSIIFVWHTGEESGMIGSGWFMDHPTIPRDSIVAQLNIDMVGRGASTDVTGQAKSPAPGQPGAELHGGDRYLQLVGSRRLSTELGDLVESVNKEKGHNFNFDYNIDADGHQQNIYCRSDHWSYAKWGIPVVFFTTGGHADYHQVTDEPQYIRYQSMAAVDSLIFDIALTAANLDHRVVVDKAKPNPVPATTCKQ